MIACPRWTHAVRRILSPIFVLQSNPYELAARSHAGFAEELLDRSFDEGLRNVQLIGDFFVRETSKYSLKHLALPLRERGAIPIRFSRFDGCSHDRFDRPLILPHLSGCDSPDCFG